MADQVTPAAITLDDLRARRAEILALAEKYGAYNVRIFGSVARGDAAAASDIDFLVTFQPWASLYEIAGLKRELEERLGCEVDVVEDHAGVRARFRERIAKDVVTL